MTTAISLRLGRSTTAAPKLGLASSGKSLAYEMLATVENGTSLMSEQFDAPSELVEISKLNGSFRRNYGTILGAYLYLRSINAARGRSFFWPGLISIACSAALAWLVKHGLPWLHAE